MSCSTRRRRCRHLDQRVNSRAEAEASGKLAQEWVHKNLPEMTKPRHVAGELVAH
jgi:hypothetical protein